MRPIKFRAWVHGKGRMVYDAFICNENELTALIAISPGQADWMQFTGLIDKQCHEIYEGDIGRDRRGNLWSISFGDKNTASFGATCITDTGAHDELYPQVVSFGWFVMHDFEVVGNIWQNPELVK